MAKYSVLFNPRSGNGRGTAGAEELKQLMKGDALRFYDVTAIEDYAAFFSALEDDEQVILAGGDGTVNHFVNDTAQIVHNKEIYYYATGSGNDFLKDIGVQRGEKPILLNPYMKDLPEVTVKGKQYKFFNAIGYGIDGYCCEIGDRLRAKSDKPINYTKIAIKGLLFDYQPTNATVTVDGVTRTYKRVWLAPTMNGRYFGGGMMASPNQDRLNKERSVSVMVMYGGLRLYILSIFPTIFTGAHLKYTKHVEELMGHEVKITFDRPTALQIDGETVLDVTEYQVSTKNPAKQRQAEAVLA